MITTAPNLLTSVSDQPAALAPDAELLLRSGGGDAVAFEELHRRFKNFVKSIVCRTTGSGTDVEDVCQNALLAIWKQAWRFDPARSGPPTWIALVTRSIALDAFRSNRRTQYTADLEDSDIPAHSSPLTPMEQEENLEEARASLDRLPPRQRAIFLLARARGLSRRQIADLEHLPVGTVKSMIRRGTDKLFAPPPPAPKTARRTQGYTATVRA